MDPPPEKTTIRFLTFSNDKEDAERDNKLREAASKIEKSLAQQQALSELIDVKIPNEEEAIDAANDTRSLYDRLLEQKNKKKEAIEDSQKLSNLITKLDEDDVDYLNEVAKAKQEEELKKRLEVYDVMQNKRRFDEERTIEEERTLKKSLLEARPSTKNSQSKLKLSSLMKLKPKMISRPSTSSTEPSASTESVVGSSRNAKLQATEGRKESKHDQTGSE